ncbi:glycoside hydrolase family 75 protein [Streptomyces sp. NPDC050287]|uniref:glycoside hydrolase family 75 protein n=1 Tax=Streptomyces sp. NPDC050287 TaxID=3365608 RepID=UPI0037BC5ABC
MRLPSLTLAAAGVALLAPTTLPAPGIEPLAHGEPVVPGQPLARGGPVTHGQPLAHGEPATHGQPVTHRARNQRHQGEVRAADLLAKVRDCTAVSRGRYRADEGAPATIPVCGTRDAVFWKADMDIDCDGRPGRLCNRRTDPFFAGTTAYQQSDGPQLSAERLPYVVVPAPSRIWDHRASGVQGGSVVAVLYRDRVRYAVVGDVGTYDVIGEASYATAKALGIRPDPHGGGTASGVTYIAFKNSRVTPIGDRARAAAIGERLARRFARR